ncbi:hypothetical protein CYMTET_13399 [Cymbomonas tetramitiformis]|uniref:Uncharacterized protein n=1 Tax=Cymbomonas tetramitiformis TaxID=36881 RepID=A0AAE0GIR0_9CHLO|nr:hypothetical protein CYMTET_13399 [Cymbomonas tetramitiformis]|eukprot:gene16381-19443_t
MNSILSFQMNSRVESFALGAGFFSMMLLLELLMEDVWTTYKPYLPDGIALYMCLFQFVIITLLSSLSDFILQSDVTNPGESRSSHAESGHRIIPQQPEEDCRSVWKILQERYIFWRSYVALAFLVFLSTAISNEAVKYVSYTVKVVFKSSKLVPTMIVSTMMGNSKKFSAFDYFAALLICGGTAVFAYAGQGDSSHSKAEHTAMLMGMGLLLISIFADALVPNAQQWFMTGQDAISETQLMQRTNAAGSLLLLLFMSVSAQLGPCIVLSIQHPYVNLNLSGIGVALFFGVFCMTRLIKKAGSVFAVGVSTCRKVVTVVLSYVFFPKPLETNHFVGGLLVLGGLILSEIVSKLKPRSVEKS